MRPVIMFSFIFIFIFSAALHSQEVTTMSVTPEQFIERVRQTETDGQRYEIVREAFKSRRFDLIRICIREPELFQLFLICLNDLEESPFQEKVVLMAMEEPWPSDDRFDLPQFGSAALPVIEPLAIKILSRILPQEGLSMDDPESLRQISSRDERMKLLTKIRIAQERPSNSESGTTISGRHSTVDERDDSRLQAPTPKEASSTTEDNAASTLLDTEPSSTPWPLVTVVIVAAIGLLWLLLKKRT